MKTLHAKGTLSAGGLTGDFDARPGPRRRGRSADAYKLGPVEGADGYDGAGWTRDPGGEVAALDTPEAKRRARSQAWLDARALLVSGAHRGDVRRGRRSRADGRRTASSRRRPKAAIRSTSGSMRRAALLARTCSGKAQDTATTVFDD